MLAILATYFCVVEKGKLRPESAVSEYAIPAEEITRLQARAMGAIAPLRSALHCFP